MGNPVVHFEIMTSNAESLGKFYTELFGWSGVWTPEVNYFVIDTGSGAGINGGIGNTEEGGGVTFYIEVPDLDKALKTIESLGGKTLTPPTVVPNVVTFAQFSDVAGNKVGLVLAGEGPGVSPGKNAPIDWFEVLGKEASKLQDFYTKAFGWTIKKGTEGGVEYGEVTTGDKKGIRGGVGANPTGEKGVTLYAKVDNLQKYLDKAADLGSKTVVEPTSVGEGTQIAVFLDPQGNPFGIYTGM